MKRCYCGECRQCLAAEMRECRELRHQKRRQSGPITGRKKGAKADTGPSRNRENNSTT